MSLLFLKEVIDGIYPWLGGKRIVFYILLQADIIIVFLFLNLMYEIKRWRRIRDR